MTIGNKLANGFNTSCKCHYGPEGKMPTLAEKGQHPEQIIFACMDSRVGPEIIHDLDPGDAFVIRSIGNLIPPFADNNADAQKTQAAIAFGMTKGVNEVILEGHTECGAAAGLVAKVDHPHITPGLEAGAQFLANAQTRGGADDQTNLTSLTEKEIIRTGLENLMTYPAVKEAVKAGNLKLTGYLFDMKAGQLLELDQTNGKFSVIAGIKK